MIQVNGKKLEEKEGKTILELLKEQEYNTAHIVVELNEEILPKSEYDRYLIQENDVIEIVCFMGGG